MDRSALTKPARDEMLDFLLARINYERAHVVPYNEQKFHLDRMRDLLARLGNPALHVPIVHVAGTKGKGSTASMIAAALTAAGYRTGLYSSPHLHRLEERAAVDGAACSESQLADLLQTIRPVVEEMDLAARPDRDRGPTYFEITTAMSLLHFARCRVDFAVLEVGLGGRLDSTNVCQPAVSVITSISFDHTKQLGNTLAEIAGEKAGIIKPNVPVVSGVTTPEAAEVIFHIAAQRGCDLYAVGRQFQFEYFARSPQSPSGWLDEPALATGSIDYREDSGEQAYSLPGLRLALPGRHQGANAAVAVAALRRLREAGFAIPEQAIRSGLSQVRCPARVEVLGERPALVVDSAHNVASVEALTATLNELFPGRPRLLVFATTKDKDAAGMLRRILPEFELIVFAKYTSNPRALPPSELMRIAKEIGTADRSVEAQCSVIEDARLAWTQLCSTARPEHVVCAAGSTFLAGEIREAIARREPSAAT